MKPLCIITGGTSGIGLELAKSLAPRFSLALVYKQNEQAAKSAMESLPKGEVKAFKRDLSDSDAVPSLFNEIETWNSAAPELLINCAGKAYTSFFVSDPVDGFLDCIEQNLFTSVRMSHYVAKKMYSARKGHIINFSSVSSENYYVGRLAYSLGKGALETFSVGLAKELGARGVRVNCVRPGLVRTRMTEPLLEANPGLEKYLVSVEQVVAGVNYLLSDGAKSVSGTVLSVDLGVRGAVSM